MEHRRPGGLRYFVVWLGRVMLASGCMTLFAGAGYGQSETKGLPIGVEAIKRMLTDHRQWTLYWDRAPVSRPVLVRRRLSVHPRRRLKFMRFGPRLVGPPKMIKFTMRSANSRSR